MTTAVNTPEIGVRIQTNGYATNYHDMGDDTGPGGPILLLHGSGPGVSAWANWRLVLPVLSQHARVLAPDLVGFGYTGSPPKVEYRRQLWVDQVVALIDALGIKTVSVVGNSFGGSLALALASQHPERVQRLVLMGACGVRFPLTDGLDKVWGYQPSPESMRELLKVFAFDHSIITDDLVQMRYRASIRDDVQPRFAAMFPAPRQRWVDALAFDDAVLRRVTQPVLLIHGREDRVIPLATSERLAQLLPNARLEVIEQCGHWVQIEKAREFQALLKAFLLTDTERT